MNIGTYNIWDDDRNYETRMKLLIDLINEKNLDILALQEVRDRKIIDRIKEECGFKHYYFKEYYNSKAGLAIFTNYTIINTWTNWDMGEDIHNSGVMCIEIKLADKVISVMNVHLDWKSMKNREIELLKALDYLSTRKSDYNILLGDFNCYSESRIHRFLTELELIDDRSECWIDLAEAYSIRANKPLEATLDFINNPRWKDNYSLDKPGRFDWIMIDFDDKPCPKLHNYELIGKTLVNGLTPSDHYGVVVELEFS